MSHAGRATATTASASTDNVHRQNGHRYREDLCSGSSTNRRVYAESWTGKESSHHREGSGGGKECPIITGRPLQTCRAPKPAKVEEAGFPGAGEGASHQLRREGPRSRPGRAIVILAIVHCRMHDLVVKGQLLTTRVGPPDPSPSAIAPSQDPESAPPPLPVRREASRKPELNS